jgi:rhamnosyltransferase
MADLLLLLDQDSEPLAGSIEELMRALSTLEAEGKQVGAVGPQLQDVKTGLKHGFHQCSRLRWKRVYPPADSEIPVPCANLNGSGTLMSIDVFQKMGGLNNKFFIDHVDTEWSFRLASRGFGLWGIPKSIFLHRMGQTSVRFWFLGWRVWPWRSPQRHYFLFRNAIWLMKRDYVPMVWKAWAILKLILTMTIHGLFDAQRTQQLKCMFAGLRDGFCSKCDRENSK